MTKHLEKLLQGCERAAAAGNIPVSVLHALICFPSLAANLASSYTVHGLDSASSTDCWSILIGAFLQPHVEDTRDKCSILLAGL